MGAIDIDTREDSRSELLREAATMAFYVAVVLDATLVAIDPEEADSTIGLIWGTTLGLALAHVFAFRLTGRLLDRDLKGDDWTVSAAQLAAASVVAALATIPVLFLPDTIGFRAGAGVMELFLGVTALLVGRARGASWTRSILFALGIVIVAGTVAGLKNAFLGH